MSYWGIIENIVNYMTEGDEVEDYLELGIANGRTFNVVAPHVKRAWAVDNRKVLHNIDKNKNLRFFYGTTDQFFEKLDKDQMFDMIFIDAAHNYDQVRKDFQNAEPHLKPNGLIFLHDTYPPSKRYLEDDKCGDSYKITGFIEADGYAESGEVITLPIYCGLTIYRKDPKILRWHQ